MKRRAENLACPRLSIFLPGDYPRLFLGASLNSPCSSVEPIPAIFPGNDPDPVVQQLAAQIACSKLER